MGINIQEEYKSKYDIRLKEPHQIQGIKKCGNLLMSVLNQVEEMIKPGLETNEINTFVHEEIIKAGATPAPLNYRGFPVHFPSKDVIIGDIIKIRIENAYPHSLWGHPLGAQR